MAAAALPEKTGCHRVAVDRSGRMTRLEIIGAVALLMAVLGLFARIMAYPLQHDEQMYLPAGVLFSTGDLYKDFGFNHFPTLPALLSAIFRLFSVEHFLLVGRVVIFISWVAAGIVLFLIAHRFTGLRAFSALAFLLLATNPVLTGAAGVLVSNNFMPIPFALLGLYLFFNGVDRPGPHSGFILLSGACLGIAVGLKANYAFLVPPFACAALFVPRHQSIGQRVRLAAFPLLLGGLIGGSPILYYMLTDLDGFLAHSVRYHTGPHVAFWQANSELGGAKAMSLGAKAHLAYTLWLSGTAVLIPLAAAFFFFVVWCRNGADALRHFLHWPIILVASLVGLGVAVSFVPTPAFPQYFAPPIAFGVVLITMLYGKLDADERATARPFLYAMAIFVAVAGAPILLADLPQIATPRRWVGIRVHQQAAHLAAAIHSRPGNDNVATLSPVYALEAGLRVYPELAAGPFVFRVADLIPGRDIRHYRRLVSSETLPALLDAAPPAAILVGLEGELDRPLIGYAEARGYHRTTAPIASHYGRTMLYVRPMPASPTAAHSAHSTR